ncbi:MAG: hypothetical protein ABJC12_13580 [Saprospiraceae bacterium]
MKILGGVVMMIVSILLYTVILWLVNYNGFINEKIKLASISYSTLAYVHAGMSSWIADLKPLFGRYWNLIQDSVKESQPPSTG